MLRHYLGSGLSVDLLLPAGLIRFKPREQDPATYLNGLGDIEVGARYDFAGFWGAGGYRPSVALRLALGLPTGKQSEVAGTSGLTPNQVLSIGRATLSVGGTLDLTQFVHRRLAVVASLGASLPLSTTSGGIHFPPVLHYGLGGLWLPGKSFTVLARLSGNHAGYTRRQDGEDLPNSGGDWLAVELSAGYRINRRWSVGMGVRVPVYADVNGVQISETVTVLGTVGLSFGGQGEEEGKSEASGHGHDDDDGHGHDDEQGKHGRAGGAGCGHGKGTGTGKDGGDVKDAAAGGRSFALWQVLVPGKVTVIDYWADWCKPCKGVDAALRRLARQHPGLAVRRVEVPDFDSSVGAEHLRGIDRLPVVQIYDRAGARTHQLVNATLATLRSRISEALAREAPTSRPAAK